MTREQWILVIGIVAVLIATLIAAKLAMPGDREKRIIATTRAGALAALERVKEWATWMAGIQTAAIAGLMLLAFGEDSGSPRQLSGPELFFVLTALLLLGAALFCSAWVLSSLPSHTIRIHSRPYDENSVQDDYDIYEQPLYGWSTRPSLGYLLNAKHWLWGGGLVALALFVGARLIASA